MTADPWAIRGGERKRACDRNGRIVEDVIIGLTGLMIGRYSRRQPSHRRPICRVSKPSVAFTKSRLLAASPNHSHFASTLPDLSLRVEKPAGRQNELYRAINDKSRDGVVHTRVRLSSHMNCGSPASGSCSSQASPGCCRVPW